MKHILGLAAAALISLCVHSAGAAPQIGADVLENTPGECSIQGGDVALSFAANGKPLWFSRGSGRNLVNTGNPGPGFYMTTGVGPDEKVIPVTSLASRDGKWILTAADETRFTLAVHAGRTHVAFRIEKVENSSGDLDRVLRLRITFDNISPEVVPLDYMSVVGGVCAPRRVSTDVSWPYLWRREDKDPLGGIALFVPLNDEDHNNSLLHIWTEEGLPHPRISGEWSRERAEAWVKEWRQRFANTHTLSLSAEKPEDLDVLFEYAKALKVNRLYLHTDTWRGAYWVYDRDPLSVNRSVFPRGEADLKAFQEKLKANQMDAMLHTLCYGFGPEGTKYMGKGKKTDHRLANWGRGRLEQSISATDTTILFRPDPGVQYPDSNSSLPWPKSYPSFFSRNEILIGDEIVPCKFTNTTQEVWTLSVAQRGASATSHEAGAEILGLLKAYNQNYYPSSRSDLPEITAREYADFFNRMGIQHNEFDGGECHNDVPWGFTKWTMLVYQNTDHPMTSNTSGGGPNPWDLVYRFKSEGAYILHKRGGGYAGMTLHREGRPSTNPLENHFTLASGAAGNSTGFMIKKPEPMFGIFPKTIVGHGLARLIADQFSTWREVAPLLPAQLRQRISDSYFQDKTPFPLDPGPALARTVFEASRTPEGYEVQPFCIMTRGKEDVEWKTVQEYGTIMPRQYVGTGGRLRLENPFGRQAPQFIIRVLSGYTDGYVDRKLEGSREELSKDMRGYLIGAGTRVEPQAENPAPALQSSPSASTLSLQPKAAQITNPGRHRFTDAGSALEVALDNRPDQPPGAAADDGSAGPQPTTQNPAPALVEHFQTEGFPSFVFRGDAQNARGVALTVTGDGSGALLLVQVGTQKDYVVPIDFKGRRDIFIPLGEVSRTTGRWGMRYHSKSAGYGRFNSVSIGFARVPSNTDARVLVENLRMVGEKPSRITNPVIHAGAGTLLVQGEIKTDQYLWYQGGDTAGVYDLNWHLLENLPVRPNNYAVEKGFSEVWIDGESADPAPWFDVQFIAKDEAIPLNPLTEQRR